MREIQQYSLGRRGLFRSSRTRSNQGTARQVGLCWLKLMVCTTALLWLTSCGEEEQPRPVVVIGIDGAEMRVIEQMWQAGKLPHLKALANRGSFGLLRTSHAKSPVIWTTIATGTAPSVHGIEDFVVPTQHGDQPVSSDTRKVPAIWNMATAAGKSVSVIGWWASWPAEDVLDGVVVSDRALLNDLDRRVSPPSYVAEFDQTAEEAIATPNSFGGNPLARNRDQVATWVGRQQAARALDLLLVYFRGVDIASHHYWKYYQPQTFGAVDPEELARWSGEIPTVYEATDSAVGAIVAESPNANVFVVSDHGFQPTRRELIKVRLDFDRVLVELGWQVRTDGLLDQERSTLWTYNTPALRHKKRVRFSASVPDEKRPQIRDELYRQLAAYAWQDGKAMFSVAPWRTQSEELLVHVLTDDATPAALVAGEPRDDLIEGLARISGTHDKNTHGVFFAAGPDIKADANLEGIHIYDLAPTFLLSSGLPVARDFVGRAWQELFLPEFLERFPLQEIESWGSRSAARSTDSSSTDADEEVMDELRALGYLN